MLEGVVIVLRLAKKSKKKTKKKEYNRRNRLCSERHYIDC